LLYLFIFSQRDGETPLVRFTGKQLIMGEPDGSSFPSGGLRSTHVARGYTAWDPNSPPFVMQSNNGACLYIPCCFFSWDQAYALDEKIPLLRSEVALGRESMKLFQVLDEPQHTRVHVDAGLEQEFFLIDRKFYLDRPDLMLTGRTVVGASPPKGQELEDQYFGPVTSRYLDCIHEFELNCWKLGIPIQTRHREVAPGQYEIAPKFAPANIGTDRNLLLMEVLRRTARKHGLAALLHEKPFAGVNGSGKHNNWSLGTNDIGSLLDPGLQPEKNIRFLMFLAATLRAVDLHSDLMRVAISGVGNDHRLGANEAPPAIVSAYLGDDLEQSLARFLENSDKISQFNTRIELGVGALPDLHRVQTDRNRTSTFAFTGNKFEFRAVGSSHNPARSNTVLNTIVAESVRYFANEIDKLKQTGVSISDAQIRVTRDVLKKHSRIIFNGNGYSAEWAEEAARRGLPNLRTTPDALDTLYSDKNINLFEGMKVFTRQELQSRSHILFEDYIKRISIEGKVLAQMMLTNIVPVAFRYQKKLSHSITAVESVMGKENSKESTKIQRELLEKVNKNLNTLLEGANKISTVLHSAHEQSNPSASAHYLEKNLKPLMLNIREASDALETVIEAKEWPLPTYHQMLFHQD
jgi:glutamine synthetase